VTPPRQPHILIVEDSALVMDALRILFTETGHQVSVAMTVREGVDACRAARPDVMLLDLTLPDGEGLEVLDRLADAERPRVSVALTGHDDPEIRRRCVAAGCRDVLLKPVPTRELLRRMTEWTGEGRGEGEEGQGKRDEGYGSDERRRGEERG
jgi:CheY-like chemotaxis protein